MTVSLIILDRDGVINFDSPHYIKSPDEWKPIPGSLDAIARLKQAGYSVAVATNQSGVGRGYYSEAVLNAIHARMQSLLAEKGASLDAIVYCPHGPEQACDCRKPKPGMILTLMARFHVTPADTLIVGDSLRDLEAGWQVRCKTVLVKTGNGVKTLNSVQEGKSTFNPTPAFSVFNDLSQFVEDYLGA